MVFVAAPRSTRQLEQLKQLLICQCMPAPRFHEGDFLREMHRRGDALGDVMNLECLVGVMISALSGALDESLKIGGVAMFKHEKWQRRHQRYLSRTAKPRNLWPVSTLQLFPYGYEDTTRSLLRWLHEPVESCAGLIVPLPAFLSQLIQCQRQAVLPYILTAPSNVAIMLEHAAGRCKHYILNQSSQETGAELRLIM